MLLRIWLTFAVVIAVVQGVLAGLAILQHNATFSDLLSRRVAVIAQTSAAAFQPIVDLGLPLSMVRNGPDVLARARDVDPGIRAAHAFNPSGIIVHSTEAARPKAVPPEILKAAQLAEGDEWSVELASEVYSGFNIRRAGDLVGSVVVAYPEERLTLAARKVAVHTMLAALGVWAVLSALSYLVLRPMLMRPQQAVAHLEQPAGEENPGGDAGGDSLFGPAIARLRRNLAEAGRQFATAERALAAAGADGGSGAPVPAPALGPTEEIAGNPSRSLAARLAARLAPVAALFILVAAVALGAATLRQVSRSFEPELTARLDLIGTVVSDDVQRAVSAGVPIDHLVGAESHLAHLLERLPEVQHVAIVTSDGRRVAEAGRPVADGASAPEHPILYEGGKIGAVVVDLDPGFVARSFRDVLLDMGVVVLVSVLLSFEVMVLLSSRSLTAPLDKLQRLAEMQALGDFSLRAVGGARSAVGRLTRLLSARAESLQARFNAASRQLGAAGPAALEELRARFRLSAAGPATLRLSYFTNIRLALFLFAAADELPASFLVLYTRAAYNPWSWIEGGILLSLPMVGFQLTAFLAAPLARRFAERYGSRRLLMLASLPVIAAYVGQFSADTVPEIVLWRTITGFGYTLLVLACEDYVIDTSAREDRDRALGSFSVVYFGGIFAGTALGGVLADRFGQATVFLVSAAFVIASLALIAWLTGAAEARRPTAQATASGSWLKALVSARLMALLVGVVAPGQLLETVYVLFLAPLVLDGLGVGVADIARCLMLYCLAVAAVGNLPGRLSAAGLTPGWGAALGQGLAGAALLTVAIYPTPLAIIVALSLGGIGTGLVRWASVAAALEMAETDLAHLGPAAVLGILRPFERIGSVAGLLVVATVANRVSYAGATAMIAIILLAGGAIFLAFEGPRRQARHAGY